VGTTYSAMRVLLQHLHQLVWPRGSSWGVESSSSFELVIHGTSSGPQYQSILDSLEESAPEDALYEEVGSRADLEDEAVSEGEGESEDEGVVMEGDAGFPWEDTRMEQWKWEEEHGEGDYRREDEKEEEEIFEFQYGDEEEDWD